MLSKLARWTVLSLVASTSFSFPVDQHPILAHGDKGSGKLGAVSSEQQTCSQVGADMLLKGGNAADALVATQFCIGVIGMHHSGIGGGGFMLVRGRDGKKEFIDFRETAPAAAFRDMFKGNRMASVLGGLASAVPGELRGLHYLHEKYGELPWADVVQPAVQIARQGWVLGTDFVEAMEATIELFGDFFTQVPTWAIDFAPNGTRLGLGDVMTRHRYASTLEKIGKSGPDVFYEGPIAEATINALRLTNGTMMLEDLRNYNIVTREVPEVEYRGYKISSGSAPSSGPVLLSILKTLELYDDFFAPGTQNLSTHRLDEAIRFGYGMRMELGDPAFVKGMNEFQKHMLSDAAAKQHHENISDLHTQNVSVYDPSNFYDRADQGTTHIVAADHSGLAISMTSTVNLWFGSSVMVPETGVIMNNDMDDFSIPGERNQFGFVPSPANYIAPGKRPLSSTSATIVERPDGSLYFTTGAAGGSRIITGTLNSIINIIDRNMSVADALGEPRLHDQLLPNIAVLEDSFDEGTAEFLRGRKHDVVYIPVAQSDVQTLRLHEDGTFEAASEPRQLNSGSIVV